jgi:hypothetical protein
MRRKAFCVVADIEPRRFDTLLTRGQVPFSKKEEGWGKYSLDDAFRLRLMLDLVDNGGCEIATAVIAMQAAITTHWLAEYPLTPKNTKNDVWLAIASLTYPSGDEFDVSAEFLAGPYHVIPKLVQGIGENVAAATGLLERVEVIDGENGPDIRNVPIDDPGYAPGRIIMANASLAARKVIHAANLLEIELTDDDFPKFSDDAPDALCGVLDAADGWKNFLDRTKGEE